MTQLLSPQDAAARLSVSRRKLFTLMQQPGFPPRIRLGARTVRIDSDALDTWVKAQSPGRSGATS